MSDGSFGQKSGRLRGSASRVLALAGMAGLLSFVLVLFPPCPPSRGSVSAASVPLQVIPQAFLPLVISSQATVPPLTIYDLYGTEQDWDWLIETFGAVTLERGTGSASVRELRAIEGPATLVVRVEDAEGNPREGVPVVFYWPGADPLPPEQQACGLDRGLLIPTKSNGNAEFGMGGGSYYWPQQGETGPHTVWVVEPGLGTDCLRGLGMLGLTNHIHLDSVWRMP